MNLSDYIEQMTVKKIANVVGISQMSVYDWKNLNSAPSPENAHKLIEYSRGLLTWELIYRPFVIEKIARNGRQGELNLKRG